jgi:hypothetical protein
VIALGKHEKGQQWRRKCCEGESKAIKDFSLLRNLEGRAQAALLLYVPPLFVSNKVCEPL